MFVTIDAVVAKAAPDMLREWANAHLVGKTVEELRAMQNDIYEERWTAEATQNAAEIISWLINEMIDEAIVRTMPEPVAVPMVIAKSEAANRYTFGPVYVPDETDLHGQAADAEILKASVWDFMERGVRDIHLQHPDNPDTAEPAGTMVELVAWPWPHTTELTKADGSTEEVTFPAGTPWMGVRWTPEAWPKVEAGEIGGLSMRGPARLRPV